ncbi:MAG: tetratricopeptide repeat protein [Spirochaetales bacterium]|nr:tetratricopeptide repeat protein [Spirochaetales bacterium]
MQLILAGIGLELLALLSLLLYDLFRVPVIISILIHIGAVYLFTRGIEPLLKKVKLIREVCFLLSLLLPIYGMLGILFQIFIVSKARTLKSIIREKAQEEMDKDSGEENFLFESESVTDLLNVHVKKIRYDYVPEHNRVLAYNYYSGTRYEELLKKYQDEIKTIEDEKAKNPENNDKLAEHADFLVEYATTIETEKTLKQRSLESAKKYLKELVKDNAEDVKILSGLMETHFLLGEYRDCMKLCKKILAKDQVHEQAVVRLAACYYRKRDYKSIIDLAKNTKNLVKKPEDLQFFTEMWTVNG